MKIKCIDNKDCEDFLTLNKIYKVTKEAVYMYYIFNNFEMLSCYNKNRFEIIKEGNKEETTITYEITYIQDGRKYVTGMLLNDIETARKFKHEYEKLNYVGNVNIVRITNIKEEVE